jgi:glycosyltransferase involved in cell wall biosynthesis
MKLSVIVPVRNYDPKIHYLTSWLGLLDFSVTQLIIVHDSNSQKNLQKLRRDLEFLDVESVNLLEVDCQSPGLSRNCGLEVAIGEFVVFWDADDLPNPSNVIMAIESANGKSDIIVGGFLKEQFDSRELVSTHYPQVHSLEYHIAVDPGIWRMIFRHELLFNIRFKEYLIGEDAEFLCRILSKNIKFEVSRNILYRYSIGSGLSLTSSKDKMDDFPRLLQDVFETCSNQGFRNSFTSAILIKLLLTYLRSATWKDYRRILRSIWKVHGSYLFRLSFILVRILPKLLTARRSQK